MSQSYIRFRDWIVQHSNIKNLTLKVKTFLNNDSQYQFHYIYLFIEKTLLLCTYPKINIFILLIDVLFDVDFKSRI